MPTVVLFDLNGTLAHPVRHPSQFPLRPIGGAYEALALLHRAGIISSVVTVQGRIGRGILRESDFRHWFAIFQQQARHQGGHISGLYLCPHATEDRCPCRKPATTLHEQALRDADGQPSDSWFIGDTSLDLLAAQGLGCRAILVRTGYGQAAAQDPVPRDAVADTALDAATLVLRHRSDETSADSGTRMRPSI